MNKRLLSVMLLALMGMTVTSCTLNPSSSSEASSSEESSSPSSSEVVLTAITISGADDIELDFQAEFNALTAVTAIGNDTVDYTSSIILQSTSQAVNLTTGAVDTTSVGVHAIRYTVSVGTVTAQKWRYVTVKSPETPEGQMLVNPDFALGTAGWDDPSVVYIADGAAMTLSTEDGALKAEVVSGANPYTPRFGQMNVPFEIDTTYEISFEAKSSVSKIINLQVGELLSGAPYFTDFKPGLTVHKTITTEWATYSYKFTHTLDNKRGGVLFELGTVDQQDTDATLWFDNVAIEVSTPDADTTGPAFTGVVADVNVTVGSEYNPMSGVTAFDVVDGDVTADIVVTIAKDGAPVETVDTSVAGVYVVTYTVEDEAGNVNTASTNVHVVSMLFKEANLISNPSFEAAFNETTPEWSLWSQNWGAAPVVTPTLDTAAGTYSIAMVGGGDAAWAIQVVQDNVLTVEQGKTYRLSLDAFSTVARPINMAVGYAYGDNQYEQYARQDAIMLGTTSGTYDFVFTVTKPTHAVKLTIELGTQIGFVDSTVVLEEVRLQEHDSEPIVNDGAFESTGWRGFFNDWMGSTGSYGIVNGEFKIDVTNYNVGEEWALQLIQDDLSLGGTTENGVIALTANATYTIGFDAYASEAMNIHPYIISSSNWANLVAEGQRTVAITTTKTHYEVTATAGATVFGNEILKFQFGDAWASFSGETKSVIFDNITVKDATNTALTSVYNGDMETVLGGHSFYSPSANNTMKRSDDGAVFNIVDLGGAAYEPHYYYIISALEAGNYAAVLTLKSTVARDFRFNIILPDAGYASILPGTKYDFHLDANVETTIAVEFAVANPLTNVKIELDFGTLGDPLVSAATVVTMKNILVYRDYNAA